MLLLYTSPAESKAMTDDELSAILHKHELLRTEFTASKELLNGAGLAYPQDTTTLRLVDGAAASSSGPLTGADVHMTAYYVVECEDSARAVAIGGELLDFHVTAVEVRAIHDSNGMS